MQVNVAFNSIGFHTAMILNRLRNERLKAVVAEQEEAADSAETREEEEARRRLALVNRRLADLAAFEDRANGVVKKKRRGGS